jgi:murein DD-endopeptidase MepM/ murein hydrolase activator NlpD
LRFFLFSAFVLTFFAQPKPALSLSLPTPPGESWRIIQGYGCGTHDDWDFYSLDLVNLDGATLAAPVRAAADGTVFAWVEPSGTLILDHGDNLFTMYTHMEPAGLTERGVAVQRASLVGYVGERGTVGNPHLHFTAFTANTLPLSDTRRSLPLRFTEGYDLPDVGGCNQHSGTVLIAQGEGTIRRQAPLLPIDEIYCSGFPYLCRR